MANLPVEKWSSSFEFGNNSRAEGFQDFGDMSSRSRTATAVIKEEEMDINSAPSVSPPEKSSKMDDTPLDCQDQDYERTNTCSRNHSTSTFRRYYRSRILPIRLLNYYLSVYPVTNDVDDAAAYERIDAIVNEAFSRHLNESENETSLSDIPEPIWDDELASDSDTDDENNHPHETLSIEEEASLVLTPSVAGQSSSSEGLLDDDDVDNERSDLIEFNSFEEDVSQ